MGNTVWAGVTWRRCGAVVSPSLQEYTHHNTVVASHYRNTPWYTSRPSLQTDLSTVARNTVLLTSLVLCILARPPVGNRERIYIHPTGKRGRGLWRQKSADIGEISQPWWRERNSCHFGKKLLILLKFMNIWNCAWQNRRARVSMCGNLRLGHISPEQQSDW